MHTNVPHLFAIGDIVGQPMLGESIGMAAEVGHGIATPTHTASRAPAH